MVGVRGFEYARIAGSDDEIARLLDALKGSLARMERFRETFEKFHTSHSE